ncbi:MAG: hypothetical protein PHO80_04020, partial [Candidatus Gracilibacteria bacterium]|nr:hypothetical protein [Candidatus Gracilibacteria bacterium]
KNIDFSDIKRKQILIKKESAEMFFADCVILTEDCKHFVEEIAKIIGEENIDLGMHWLNNNNISVLNCGGKSWFNEYKNLLDFAEIPNYILSDFDYLRDGGIENLLDDNIKIELNTLKSQINTVYEDFEIDFDELKNKLEIKDFQTMKNRLDKYLKEAKKRCKNGNYKNISDIEQSYHPQVNLLRKKLKNIGIFLLDGELEDYYLEGKKPSKNKEGGVIEIVGKIIEENKKITDFVDISQIKEFLLFLAKKERILKEESIKDTDVFADNLSKETFIEDKKLIQSIKEVEISIEDIPF